MQIQHMRQRLQVTYASPTCTHTHMYLVEFCRVLSESALSVMFYCGIVLRRTLTATPTCTLAHPTARRGIRAQNTQPFIAQSEVTLTQPYFRHHLPHKCHLKRGRHDCRVAPLRSQHNMTSFRSSDNARESVKHAFIRLHICTQIDTGTHTRRHKAKRCTNSHRFVCLRILGSCSLCFLSACRSILVVVRAQQHISNLLISPHAEPASYKL